MNLSSIENERIIRI